MSHASEVWAAFFAGGAVFFVVGGVFGLFLCSLCMAGSRDDSAAEAAQLRAAVERFERERSAFSEAAENLRNSGGFRRARPN